MSVNDHSYIIIGGSTKCATTSVFAYLADHPQISGSKIKESRFFWKGNYPLKKEGFDFEDGIEMFDSLFDDKTNAKYRLEATPDYLYSSKTASLIKENLKDVRIIFIVRDPIDRVVSWFKFAKQLNLINANESIDDFIENQFNVEGERIKEQHLHAVEQGCYGRYLEHYIKIFGRDRIKVIKYEQLTVNPSASLANICDFIEIDSGFYKSYDFKVLNQSVNVVNAVAFNKYRDLRRKIRRSFKNIIPENFRQPFTKFFKKFDSIYVNKATSKFEEIVISEKTKNKLFNYYAEDKLIVESIMNS